jgi:hypothetical protein
LANIPTTTSDPSCQTPCEELWNNEIGSYAYEACSEEQFCYSLCDDDMNYCGDNVQTQPQPEMCVPKPENMLQMAFGNFNSGGPLSRYGAYAIAAWRCEDTLMDQCSSVSQSALPAAALAAITGVPLDDNGSGGSWLPIIGGVVVVVLLVGLGVHFMGKKSEDDGKTYGTNQTEMQRKV